MRNTGRTNPRSLWPPLSSEVMVLGSAKTCEFSLLRIGKLVSDLQSMAEVYEHTEKYGLKLKFSQSPDTLPMMFPRAAEQLETALVDFFEECSPKGPHSDKVREMKASITDLKIDDTPYKLENLWSELVEMTLDQEIVCGGEKGNSNEVVVDIKKSRNDIYIKDTAGKKVVELQIFPGIDNNSYTGYVVGFNRSKPFFKDVVPVNYEYERKGL